MSGAELGPLGLLGVLTAGLLTPGPDLVLVLKNSLGPRGRRRGLATAAGIAAGLAVQMAVLVHCIGYLATLGPGWTRAGQGAGALVLFVLAWRAWQSGRAEADAAGEAVGSVSARGFTEGLLCNLTNAKALAFFLALFLSAAGADADFRQRVWIGGLVVAHGWVCWSALVFLVRAPWLQHFLERRRRTLRRVFASLLAAFALVAAWAALG